MKAFTEHGEEARFVDGLCSGRGFLRSMTAPCSATI